jgi:hypothetical protein
LGIGNAAKVHIQKPIVLKKRALRLMNFKSFQDHAIPLFLSTYTLPVTMIYVKKSAYMLYDILKGDAPEALHELFTKTSSIITQEWFQKITYISIFLVWNYKSVHFPESVL